MNAKRRKELATIAKQVNALKQQFDNVLSEEENAYDDMPDSLKEGERGNDSQEAIESLQGISSMIDEALDDLCTLADVVLPVAKASPKDQTDPTIKSSGDRDVERKARDRRIRKSERAQRYLREIGFLILKKDHRAYQNYYRGVRDKVTDEGSSKISKARRTFDREADALVKEIEAVIVEQTTRINILTNKYSLDDE